MDVAKVDPDDAHVAMAIYIYVARVYLKCFICFRRMLQVFYLDVAYVAVAIHMLQAYVANIAPISDVYCRSASSDNISRCGKRAHAEVIPTCMTRKAWGGSHLHACRSAPHMRGKRSERGVIRPQGHRVFVAKVFITKAYFFATNQPLWRLLKWSLAATKLASHIL